MTGSEEIKADRPSHPQYLALTIDPLFGDDEPREGLELVPGFDLAWGGDPGEPEICFIAADGVKRDFGGKMMLFEFGRRSGGLWIACDAILWMRPATRMVDPQMCPAPFKRAKDSAADPPIGEARWAEVTDLAVELSRVTGVKGQMLGAGEARIHVTGEMDQGTQWCLRCNMPVGVDLEGHSHPAGAFLREQATDGSMFTMTVCRAAEILSYRVPFCDPDDRWDPSSWPDDESE